MKNIVTQKYSHIRQYFVDFQNKTISNKGKNKLTKYHQYLGVLILITLLTLAKEFIINFFVITQNLRKPSTSDWIFYSYQNKEKYIRKISKRKILIVAGSNALFGINAKQIEASTGVPTVNFGVSAGLGPDYILYKAKQMLKADDIAVLPIEYTLFYQKKDKQLSELILRNYVISYDHSYLRHLSLVDKLKMLVYPPGLNQDDIVTILDLLENQSPFDKNLIYQKSLERARLGKCYTGLTLDKNGDEQCNITNSPSPDLEKNEQEIEIDAQEPMDVTGSIRDFCLFAKNNRITIIPLYPVTMDFPDYKSERYQNFFTLVKKFWEGEGISFEDSLSQSLIDKKMMFDHPYHTNDTGRTLRTKQVLEIIKKHI